MFTINDVDSGGKIVAFWRKQGLHILKEHFFSSQGLWPTQLSPVGSELTQSINLLIRRAKAMVLKRGRHVTKSLGSYTHHFSPFSCLVESDGGDHVRMVQREWAQVVLISIPGNTERQFSLSPNWGSLGKDLMPFMKVWNTHYWLHFLGSIMQKHL